MTSCAPSTVPVVDERTRRPARHAGAPSQGVVLCLQMMRSGFLLANLALVASTAVSWFVGGRVGAVNAACAGVLVLVFFATGQGVQMVAGERADGAGLLLLLGSFVGRCAALGLLLWFAMQHSSVLEPTLRVPAFMAGAVAVTCGWLAGVLGTGLRQHVLTYDSDFDASHEGGDRV